MKTTRAVMTIFSCSLSLVIVTTAARASQPVAVSPGELQETVLINETCPTFSWTSVDGAEAYELVVWLLSKGAEESAEPEAVVEQTLPRGAQAWTPSLGQCLTRGERYAWAVRAIGGEGTGEWSEPSLFAVAAGPTESEFQEALAIVRRYVEIAGASATPDPETEVIPPSPAGSGERFMASKVEVKALSTAPAAIHAEPSATVGEVVGVRGVVNSSGGAAGVFNNTAGGKILSGLSSATEVFNVNNSGVVSATSFSGDGSSLTNVTADDVSCTSCVDGSDIADNSVSSADINNESISSSDIGLNAVGTSEVEDNSLTASDLASNSVGSSELQSNAVDSSKVLDNSLTAFDLASSSVGSSELQSNAVDSSKVLDNSLTSLDLAAGSVGSSEVIDGSLTSSDLASSSVGSSEIQSGAVGSAEVNSSQVQLRVSGSCPSGQSIRVINSNGTVSCEVDTVGSPDFRRFSADYSVSFGGGWRSVTWTCPTGRVCISGGATEADVGHDIDTFLQSNGPRADQTWYTEVQNPGLDTETYRFQVWDALN